MTDKLTEEIITLANALEDRLATADAKSVELQATIADCQQISAALQTALKSQPLPLPLEATPVPNARDMRRLAAEADLSVDSVERVYLGGLVKQTTADAVLRAAKTLGIPEPSRLNVKSNGRKESLWFAAKN